MSAGWWGGRSAVERTVTLAKKGNDGLSLDGLKPFGVRHLTTLTFAVRGDVVEFRAAPLWVS